MHLGERQSYVTLATNDEYAIGALVLGQSLRLSKTDKELTILITDGVPHNFRILLGDVFDNLVVVKSLHSGEEGNLNLLRRPDLGITYTKLYCWKLIEFSKCVFLDADTIVLQNIDELFQREEVSAAPDASWPDVFNSGVFVYRPSLETFDKLSLLAKTRGSFDGGDQGLLNEYFNTWSTDTLDKHLPFTYNCSCWIQPNDKLMFYTRPAVWKKFWTQVKVAHFAGFEKPWKHRMSANDGAICQAIDRLEVSDTIYTTAEQDGIVALWWAVFFKRVKNQLGNGMFLSTTFEPIPPPPPPPSPQDNRPENQEFWNQNEKYHPEFDDNSFDFLHTNQRVDESNRYGKYHEFFEPPKPPETEHHKYYVSHHHKSHDHQPPVYNEHHQCHHNEFHYQPPQFKPPPECHDFHHQNHHEKCHHQENRHEEPHEWHQDQPQQHQCQEQPHSEHPHQSECAPLPSAQMKQPCGEHHGQNREVQHHPPPRQPSPQQHCETSSPTSPPGPRNDKDPLFFAKKPMCRECLRELQWSRQFFDFLHRDIPISMSPTYFRSRVRPQSQPKSLPGQKTIHGVLKKSSTPSTITILDEDNSKINAREQRKGGKKKEKGLHQVHKGKSASKKLLKKPADSSKLIDAAKRRIQAKTDNTSPSDKTSVEPIEKIKASPIKNLANKEKEPRTEITLAPILRSARTRRSEVSEDNQLKQARPRLGTVTQPASVTRAKRQTKPLSGPQKAGVEALIRKKITSTETATDRGSMELPETDEGVKPKAHPELESEPGLNKAKDLKAPSLPKPEETKTERIVQEELQNIQKLRSVKEMTTQKTEPKERMKKKINNVEAGPKQVVEKPVVDSTPWLPCAKKSQFRSQKFSDHEYFCDRHRPHPPPPQWKMFAWERGQIDYMGSDRFSNILARIRSTIQQSNDDALLIGVWL